MRKNGSWTISHPPRMAPQPFETGPPIPHRDAGSAQSIYVGPVSTLQALTQVSLKPVIDAVYPFKKAEEAFEQLRSASHFGKLVIQVSAPGA
ncbi:zinc-binding dehydrogenase [Pseudomonas sp. NPDC089406]|uniref:zinc-binding dehydrogenase n=1 Tax=Pseudomonas sp. NPDC089406 TaxID=3364463 RepID=UPI00384F4A88